MNWNGCRRKQACPHISASPSIYRERLRKMMKIGRMVSLPPEVRTWHFRTQKKCYRLNLRGVSVSNNLSVAQLVKKFPVLKIQYPSTEPYHKPAEPFSSYYPTAGSSETSVPFRWSGNIVHLVRSVHFEGAGFAVFAGESISDVTPCRVVSVCRRFCCSLLLGSLLTISLDYTSTLG
jgi:hypothetical protein